MKEEKGGMFGKNETVYITVGKKGLVVVAVRQCKN
jgi:hypothetical protein